MEKTITSPNGTVLNKETLDEMMEKHTRKEMEKMLGYKDIRKLVGQYEKTFEAKWVKKAPKWSLAVRTNTIQKDGVTVVVTPNGTEVTYKKLMKMIDSHPTVREVAHKLGYKSPASLVSMVTRQFKKKWKTRSPEKRNRTTINGEKAYITKNGTKITYTGLVELTKTMTYQEIANHLGYESRAAVTRLFNDVFGKKPIPKGRLVKETGYIITPNGTKVDMDMLNLMLSHKTRAKVAKELGYKHSSSISNIVKRLDGQYKRYEVMWLDDEYMRLLREMHCFLIENRYAPNLPELADLMFKGKATIKHMLKELEDRGYIETPENKRKDRSYHLTDKAIEEVFGEAYLSMEKQIIKYCFSAAV